MREGEQRSQFLARRLTRRRVLRAALLGGAGLAGVAVAACGRGGKEAAQPTATAGQTLAPTEEPPVRLVTPVAGLARLGWTELEPSGELPAPRVGHSLVWDDAGEQVYLFGGNSAGTPLGDLWAFNVDPPAWRKLEVEGPRPSARFGHGAVFDPQDERLLVFEGRAGETFLNDLWAYSPGDNTWKQIAATGPLPPPREAAAAALDAEASRLYVTHGVGVQGYLDDTWVLDLATGMWEDISPAVGRPSARSHLRAAWDSVGGRLLMFGGEGAEKAFLGDLWSFDPAGGLWEEVPPNGRAPPARSRFGAAYASDRRWWLIVGGTGEGGDLVDIWFYIAEQGWGSATSYGIEPGGRSGHDLAFVPHRASLILFGGAEDGQETQAVWELGIGRAGL